MLAAASLAIAAGAQAQAAAFPPGWNGLARTPPRGWRSRLAFGSRITQELMAEQMDALTARNRSVPGRGEKVSLAELGYRSFGVDGGWERCGEGADRTEHAADGTPLVAKAFPDVGALVDAGHREGLRMGWSLNGCGERVAKDVNYAGDVALLQRFALDEVRLEPTGAQLNLTHYAELMGKRYVIESSHWNVSDGAGPDAAASPTRDWCPFNLYRTSADITTSPLSWFDNLQSVLPFLQQPFRDETLPLSQPGCWAYPDMLEVGRVENPTNASATWYSWNRAHFGAWCVVSAPLILGLELSDAALAPILDVIGNEEAIRVNQLWAGSPGYLVEEAWYDWPYRMQVWAKPLPGGALAVLAVNKNAHTVAAHKISLAALVRAATSPWRRVAVRDIWARADRAPVSGPDLEITVGAYDSEFLLLSPADDAVLV